MLNRVRSLGLAFGLSMLAVGCGTNVQESSNLNSSVANLEATKFTDASGNSVSLKKIFEDSGKEYMMVDFGGVRCSNCKIFARTINTDSQWKKALTGPKCGKVYAVKDSINGWVNNVLAPLGVKKEDGLKITYKSSNIVNDFKRFAPSVSFRTMPGVLLIKNDGSMIANFTSNLSTSFKDTLMKTCL